MLRVLLCVIILLGIAVIYLITATAVITVGNYFLVITDVPYHSVY